MPVRAGTRDQGPGGREPTPDLRPPTPELEVPSPECRSLRVLVLGDICAKPGRQAVAGLLGSLKAELSVDFVVANAENAAAGYGITPGLSQELLQGGVDCLTTGDHFLDRKEITPYLDTEPRLLRPLNYPDGVPGRGYGVYTKSDNTHLGQPPPAADGHPRLAVVNLLGRTFMKAVDSPFQRVRGVIDQLREVTKVILVDFHAEATAEKQCLAWYLDGKVSAVYGTHTHVATADERVLPGGTAYITDIGMCGGMDGILGMRREAAVRRMMCSIPLHLEPSRENIQVNGILLEIDAGSGRAVSIIRLSRPFTPPPAEVKEPGAAAPGAPPRPPTPDGRSTAPNHA